MDKPHQSDSFAGHVEGQIARTAFGSVGVPLYKHERKGQKQQQRRTSKYDNRMSNSESRLLCFLCEFFEFVIRVFVFDEYILFLL